MNRRLQRRKLRDDEFSNRQQRDGNTATCKKNPAEDSEAAKDMTELGNSEEIVSMLEKINRQLEKMQQPEEKNTQNNAAEGTQQTTAGAGNGQPQAQGQQSGQGENGSVNASNQMTQDLQAMLSQLLQNKGQQPAAVQAGQNQANTNAASQGEQNKQPETVVAQTAAQVLAKAQYELANELEESLKKLKQVISESEKIANRISNLLGEENSSK